DCEDESEVSVKSNDARNYVENSKVSESLLLMKFYSLSRGVVSHLLSGKKVDLTMQVTDEQIDIISSRKSSFITGRSGTGKTTLLTTKLFQHEQKFRIDSDGIYEGENKLTNIPGKSYPLIITFQKFLMMLDGTLGNSFFKRFLEAREGYHGNIISSRFVALQTLIRLRDVTFDRFCLVYWPHFNSDITKNLDCSRVFTEIISHIKGGLQAWECIDGRLSYERYSLLAESRSSTLTKEKRDMVYKLFQTYEKMKAARGEFDLGDLVNDIHCRLKNGKYRGDQMDFVYINEVQDLSMRQISLFKYISQNVDEGFIFAGDTAQTIARGIDFRTYAGVLDLAQSVIDILYYYFVHSIDNLEPKTSLISGEAPVLLEFDNDKNAIVTIFGGSESSGEVVGFDAKQVILLYVAITRTRQRLWICENKEELSKPMFNYWKMRGLVQIKKLDDSVAQAMWVFLNENNFVMATMSFERARNTMWEKLAKASGLRASTDQMRGTNHEAFKSYVKEAASIFKSIGKLESAASCYCDLGEYERAGKIYLSKCGKIDAAAECFTLSSCYSDAAEDYAKGDISREIRKFEQIFLENGALSYHQHNDPKSMMKFVRAFCSMNSKRVFLRSLGRRDDLLSLEEESGHFLEAAEQARLLGDVLKEADLLEKARHFKKAAFLVLWYVLLNSLWGNGNKGWPLKQFPHKEELCNKVKWLAKQDSDKFYDFVCNEINLLSDQSLPVKVKRSDFHQGVSLLHIDDVSNFLYSCKYFNLTPPFDKLAQSSMKKSSEGDLDYWTIGRVIMTCLGFRTSLSVYEIMIKNLESKPMWKLFVGKLRDVGFREDLVLLEFMLALKDALRAGWSEFGNISPDSFVRLFDCLLFVASWLCQSFYTAKSSFAGWFTHLHSTATPTKLSPKPEILKRIISTFVEIVQKILYERKRTFLWCRLSSDDRSFYYKLLALKLVMMLALVLLEEPDDSKSSKEKKRSFLNPEVVAEAFMSVKDPLVIACRGDLIPNIHAPCAIFVDLNKSKEEIMRVLFLRKNTHSVNSSHNVDVGTILEPPSRGDCLSLFVPESKMKIEELNNMMNALASITGQDIRLESNQRLDGFLKGYVSQEPKAAQMVLSECSGSSSTTEVEQTCDDELVEASLESRSSDSSTLDAKNKIAKGNKKRKKGKHIKGKKK
ncbi:UvrD-like helicase, ATP-binding domain, P-loop containing nucleoside triphosphate hydrolase, partial [Tanacetum coccineum]